MNGSKHFGASVSADPDDAPELLAAFFDEAEIRKGEKVIRRGRGRPKLSAAKKLVSVRLDPDVLAKLREKGPGWQTHLNILLRQVLQIPGRSLADRLGAGAVPKARAVRAKSKAPVRARKAG